VSLFRRSPSPLPERKPHPDARIEAELQRIISLRKVIARKEAQLEQNAEGIERIRNVMRGNSGSAWNSPRAREADALQRESAQLEAEVTKLHDEIAERIAARDDTDLAWLDGHRIA
jgi:hypothetical protein